MVDIRKRTGVKGVTYQVRRPDASAKSGHSYKTFSTLKEARHYVEHELPRHRGARHDTIRQVKQAVEAWLQVCQFEGREGSDPVTSTTLAGYKWRSAVMLTYEWTKPLHELERPDCVAFRSWLLKTFSRDKSRKVFSSFHSVLLEMVSQGVLSVDPAAGLTIQRSRYQEPVRIPSVEEVQAILATADKLATHENKWIARAWKRYRPMVYLAADSGMRPQEYLVLPLADLLDKGVRVTQALERSQDIGPPKTPAGRRYIPISQHTLALVRDYVNTREGLNPSRLVFPGKIGGHQQYTHFLDHCWNKLMKEAGLVETRELAGKTVTQSIYTPYSLRHFYASMLISRNVDLKTVQERMGHTDATLTLNVYGHLIRQKRGQDDDGPGGILDGLLAQPTG